MSSLHEIGLKYGTDKTLHVYNGQSYLQVYEAYLQHKRDKVSTVLEFGVLGGASLCTWRDYFPNADVYGVDIDPTIVKDHGPRAHVITASQADPAVLSKVPLVVDVIIDDGSHLVDHIIQSFTLWYPRLAFDGIYIIEDLECVAQDLTPHIQSHPGLRFNDPKTTNFVNSPAKLHSEFFAKLIAIMNSTGPGTCGPLNFIHFYPNTVVISKHHGLHS